MTARLLSALIFAAAASIVTGFGLALWFEALAIFTGKEQSISQLASGTIANHWPYALLATALIFTVVGALLAHFTNWRP